MAAYLARLYRCYLIGYDVECILKETLRSTCATFTCANPVYRCGLVREKAEVVAYYTVPRPVHQWYIPVLQYNNKCKAQAFPSSVTMRISYRSIGSATVLGTHTVDTGSDPVAVPWAAFRL